MPKGQYEVVVTRPQFLRADWEWEVYRDGSPLPARLRERGFRSERSARGAGALALRRFLRALREEQQWGADAVTETLFEGLHSPPKSPRR
jgi:hypothetical protein